MVRVKCERCGVGSFHEGSSHQQHRLIIDVGNTTARVCVVPITLNRAWRSGAIYAVSGRGDHFCTCDQEHHRKKFLDGRIIRVLAAIFSTGITTHHSSNCPVR